MKRFSSKIIPLVLFMSFSTILASCQESVTGFDGQSYDISKNGDGSLTATLDAIKGGYTLTIAGQGASKDFDDIHKTPWYGIAKKVKDVNIQEGISSLGTNIFNKLSQSSFVLPKSVTSISNSSFKNEVSLYSLGQNEIEGSSSYKTYYFAEEAPSDTSKTYWHYVNNQIVLWKTIHTLFIGNSFTFYSDIPYLTQKVANSLGYSFVSDSVTKGAWTLTKFADSADEMGTIVDQKLANNQYEYVILQEQSMRPLTAYSGFLSATKTLQKKINSTQVSAEIHLYSTWGYQEAADTNKTTIPELEKSLRGKYEDCASALKTKINYVGKAFSDIYENHKEINLYYSDDKHPSYAGAYLSALVHVGSLLGTDVRGCSYVGDNEHVDANGNKGQALSEANAKALQEAAYNAVFNK